MAHREREDMDITLVGNLTDDPLVVINENSARVQFSVAVSDSYKDTHTGEWKDKPVMYWPVYAWNTRARKIAEADLVKGSRVIVHGTLRANAWRDNQGGHHRRTVVDIKARGARCELNQPKADRSVSPVGAQQEELDVGEDRTNAWDQPASSDQG